MKICLFSFYQSFIIQTVFADCLQSSVSLEIGEWNNVRLLDCPFRVKESQLLTNQSANFLNVAL